MVYSTLDFLYTCVCMCCVFVCSLEDLHKCGCLRDCPSELGVYIYTCNTIFHKLASQVQLGQSCGSSLGSQEITSH